MSGRELPELRVRLTVDTTDLDAAIAKVDEFKAKLDAVGVTAEKQPDA